MYNARLCKRDGFVLFYIPNGFSWIGGIEEREDIAATFVFSNRRYNETSVPVCKWFFGVRSLLFTGSVRLHTFTGILEVEFFFIFFYFHDYARARVCHYIQKYFSTTKRILCRCRRRRSKQQHLFLVNELVENRQ